MNFREISRWQLTLSSCISGTRLRSYRDIRTYNIADVYIMYTCTYHDAIALLLFVLRHWDSDHHLENIEIHIHSDHHLQSTQIHKDSLLAA